MVSPKIFCLSVLMFDRHRQWVVRIHGLFHKEDVWRRGGVSNDEMHLWSQHTFATEAAAQWSKMNYQAGQEKYHVASVGACFKV